MTKPIKRGAWILSAEHSHAFGKEPEVVESDLQVLSKRILLLEQNTLELSDQLKNLQPPVQKIVLGGPVNLGPDTIVHVQMTFAEYQRLCPNHTLPFSKV